MKRVALAMIIAALAGGAAGYAVSNSPAFRDLAGLITGRGHLLACVESVGLYESDLEGRLSELEENGLVISDESGQRELLRDLVAEMHVREAARGEPLAGR